MFATLKRIIKLLFTWRVKYSTLEKLEGSNAIFAFSFGQGENKTPGATNKAIAVAAKNLSQKTKLPIFAQWEIAEELQRLNSEAVYAAYPRKGYLSTKGVADQFTPHAKKHKIKLVIILAHPDHQYRCGEILKKLGFEVMFAKVENFLPNSSWRGFGCDSNGYSILSTQPWCRKRTKFIPFEIRKRLEGYFKGDL